MIRWYNNLLIGRKFIVAAFCMICLTVMISIIALLAQDAIHAQVNTLLDEEVHVAELSLRNQNAASMVRTLVQEMAVISDPEVRATMEVQVEEQADFIRRNLAEMRRVETSATGQELLGAAERSLADFQGTFLAGDTERYQAALEELERQLEQLYSHAVASRQATRQAMDASIASTARTIMAVGGLSAVIGMLLAFILSRMMTAAIGQVVAASTELSEKSLPRLVQSLQALSLGDLSPSFHVETKRVDVDTKDEMGTMARAFNQINEALEAVGAAFDQMVCYQQRIANALTAIADGDLMVEIIPLSAKDVLGMTGRKMVTNLRSLTAHIHYSAEELDAASQKLDTAVAESGESMDKLVRRANRLAEKLEGESTAAEPFPAEESQAAAAELTQAAQQARQQMEAIAVAVERLARTAHELRLAVDFFKLDGSHHTAQASNGTAKRNGRDRCHDFRLESGTEPDRELDSGADTGLNSESHPEPVETDPL